MDQSCFGNHSKPSMPINDLPILLLTPCALSPFWNFRLVKVSIYSKHEHNG